MADKGKKKKKPLHEYPERRIATKLYTHIGYESMRRHGIHAVDDNVVISAAGNAVLFVNINTGNINSQIGPEDGAIGAVCVHPDRKMYVVCEKSPVDPLVLLYSYPAKMVKHTLRKGGEKGFSACSFNDEGNFLATVAIEPDFVITVWDWAKESIVLRNKAFGSDVYFCMFSPFQEQTVVTAGSGHIKFWEMAHSFTGLKLQGQVGKFGRVDLSDINSAICLPDGKVVSGSESGYLLLWEGGIIKCELGVENLASQSATGAESSHHDESMSAQDASAATAHDDSQPQHQSERSQANFEASVAPSNVSAFVASSAKAPAHQLLPPKRCHDGPIDVVMLIEQHRILLSAGHDGYIRYWRVSDIDLAENAGSQATPIKLLKELYVGDGIKIRAMTLAPSRQHWIIQDACGTIRRVPYWGWDLITSPAPVSVPAAFPPLMSFNAGGLGAVAASPTDHTCVTGGMDGTLRLINYINKAEIYQVKFDAPICYLEFLNIPGDKERRTFIAAFSNGSVRILKKARNTFEVKSEVKPHTQTILDVAVGRQVRKLYTISADGTAFYFDIEDNGTKLVPIGFCKLPGVPTTCTWNLNNDRCLVGFADGSVIAMMEPDRSTIDHNIGYEFTAKYSGLGYRQKLKPPEKDKKPVQGDGFEMPVVAADAEDDEEDDLAVEEDLGPWAVNFIRLIPATNKMLIAMDKPELAYEYAAAKWYEDALGPPPIPEGHPEPKDRVEEPGRNLCFRDLTASRCIATHPDYLIQICDRNKLLLRPMKNLDDVTQAMQLHDGIHGTITGVAVSYDAKLLITVADDGMTFVQSIGDAEPPTDVDAVKLENLPAAPMAVVKPLAYSVQEQKERDDRLAAEEAALGVKEQLRRKIRIVHEAYDRMLDENEQANGGERLTHEEILLDDDLESLLKDQSETTVREALQETVWTSAKKETQMKKLLDTYTNNLDWERFMVHSFNGSISVASFRTPKLTEAQLRRYEAIPRGNNGLAITPQHPSSPTSPQTRTNQASPDGSPASQAPKGDFATAGEQNPLSAANDNDGVSASNNASGAQSSEVRSPTQADPNASAVMMNSESQNNNNNTNNNSTLTKSRVETNAIRSQLEKAEQRKRERLAREEGKRQWKARNPAAANADVPPEDCEEVVRFRGHYGAYPLKTGPQYEIAPHLRPTADRKAKQLVLLEHSINDLRHKFNVKLLRLRDVKATLCASINADRKRVAELCELLKQPCDISAFELQSDEQPEKMFDISQSQLEKYEKEAIREAKRKIAMERAKRAGGELADTSAAAADDDEEAAEKAAAAAAAAAQKAGRRTSRTGHLSGKDKFELDLKNRLEKVEGTMTELENEEAMLKREKWLYEKARLERRIEKTTRAFDESLDILLHEKLRAEADLIMADMRALLLFREYLLLLDFKQKDNALAKSLEQKQNDKDIVHQKCRDLVDRIADRDAQLAQARVELDQLKQEFASLIQGIPESAFKSMDRIYFKRIKRSRRNAGEDEDDGITSSDEDEDDEDDEYADDGEEDQCPNQVDEATFKAVLALRERRLDIDEEAMKKALDKLKGELVTLEKQEQQADKAFRQVDDDIKKFQNEKQKELNLLETIVVLKLSQIQCLINNHTQLPSELRTNAIVVFTRDGLKSLKKRIGQLDKEKDALRVNSHTLDSERTKLQRRLSKKNTELSEFQNKLLEQKLLKFGQEVRMEDLENLSVDRETEELKAELKAEELKWERELAKVSEKLALLKQSQQQRIAENTAHLKDLGSMRAEQHDLEANLTESSTRVVAKMSGGSKVATAADRAHLKDLVVAQQQEIDALKTEIAMLRRKGGHVYTPVVNRVQVNTMTTTNMNEMAPGTN